MKNFFCRAWLFLSFSLPLLFVSCSPIKSSPLEQKHQTELTLHEMQTNIDDIHHNIQCFQTEFNILDEKIKHYEDTLAEVKQNFLSKMETQLFSLREKTNLLESKLEAITSSSHKKEELLHQLNKHAQDSTLAFSQYKKKMQEIESSQLQQNKQIEEFATLKETIEEIAQALEIKGTRQFYQVKTGDSLEKIAKKHGISTEALKKANQLKKGQDLIFSGQKLKIPTQ